MFHRSRCDETKAGIRETHFGPEGSLGETPSAYVRAPELIAVKEELPCARS
jgi:hypothetical protein